MAQHNLKARINALLTFSLYAIDNSDGLFKVNERPSNFIEQSLMLVGNAIRPQGSRHFWLSGKYLWFTDATQQHVAGVWATNEGGLMYQDGEDLVRIIFD